LIQTLKPKFAPSTALPEYKKWALFHTADGEYVMLDAVFLTSIEMTKKGLLALLNEHHIWSHVNKGTQAHLKLIQEAYPNRKITGSFSVMNTEVLRVLSQKGHQFTPAVQEFLEDITIRY
jgi:hypothetical protein